MLNVVGPVMSPSELLYWSKPWAVNGCAAPARIVALGGATTRWSNPSAVTVKVAVAVLVAWVPVTVWSPATVEVQLAPVQLPPPAMLNVVVPVMSPSELLYWSKPWAVNGCAAPARIVALGGATTRWSNPSAVTVKVAVAVLVAWVPVTVWSPATVEVQLAPVQLPPPAMLN